MDEAELLEVFATHWSSDGFFSREHEEARYASGEAALRRFLADQLRDGASLPVAVERPFSVRLGRDTVRGRYDRLDETPAGTVITDYKSSDVRDPKKAAEKARDSLQLQLYALAYQAETGDLPAAVELHFLESGLTGRVIPDPARLEKTPRGPRACRRGHPRRPVRGTARLPARAGTAPFGTSALRAPPEAEDPAG